MKIFFQSAIVLYLYSLFSVKGFESYEYTPINYIQGQESIEGIRREIIPGKRSGVIGELNDDEVSLGLSEISLEDLNMLDKLISNYKEQKNKSQSKKRKRNLNLDKRVIKRDKRMIRSSNIDNSLYNASQDNIKSASFEYIKMLENSFPRDEANGQESEHSHIRVKRVAE